MLSDAPKICTCFPVVGLLIFLSAFAIVVNVIEFIFGDQSAKMKVGIISGIAVEVITIFAILKRNTCILRVFYWLTIVSIAFLLVFTMTVPIVLTGSISSGILNGTDVKELEDFLKISPNITDEDATAERFISGMSIGLVLEFFMAISIAMGLLKVVLLNRTINYFVQLTATSDTIFNKHVI